MRIRTAAASAILCAATVLGSAGAATATPADGPPGCDAVTSDCGEGSSQSGDSFNFGRYLDFGDRW
jgi:hypothetical protein